MGSSPLSILLVEDAPGVRAQVVELLCDGRRPVQITEAATCADAKRASAAAHFDLAIVDIRLPDGSGIDLVRDLKERDSRIVVVVFSNFASPPYRRACLEAGATHVLDKSRDFGALGALLDELR